MLSEPRRAPAGRVLPEACAAALGCCFLAGAGTGAGYRAGNKTLKNPIQEEFTSQIACVCPATPARTRPARPARCSAEAREMSDAVSDSMRETLS
jgi:hypothetical protein